MGKIAKGVLSGIAGLDWDKVYQDKNGDGKWQWNEVNWAQVTTAVGTSVLAVLGFVL